jgi:signal transduction histidine kinase
MKPFSTARIKLTLWYMLISYVLLGLFTVAVISAEKQAFAQVIDLVHSHVRGVVFNIYLQQQIEDFEQHFSQWLLLFDAAILIVATLASYFLSGRTLKPIEEVMKEREQFTADISHELRTPLASMAMEIEAYQRGRQTKAEATVVMDSLQQEIRRMTDLVSGLMRLVRLEQAENEEPLVMTMVDLSQIVSASMESFKNRLVERQLMLAVELPPRLMVIGNPDELRQVVLILLDNAIKYTPAGGRLEVATARWHDWARLTVFNDGPGIEADDLPLVFNRFYRGRNAGDEGSGLGLAIARQLIEQHKGTVAVASTKDHGVTFRVLLPLPQPSSAETD